MARIPQRDALHHVSWDIQAVGMWDKLHLGGWGGPIPCHRPSPSSFLRLESLRGARYASERARIDDNRLEGADDADLDTTDRRLDDAELDRGAGSLGTEQRRGVSDDDR